MAGKQISLSRRQVVATMGLLGAGSLLPAQALFAQSGLPVQKLRDNVYLIDAGGSNVIACDTGEGLMLVDSGAPASADALMATLAGLGTGVVHTLFNTHWHGEQCGANELLGAAGARIVASAKSWHHLSVDYYLPPESRYHRALPESGRPSVAFHTGGQLALGGVTADYDNLVQAHTDGDIYVFLREANVLVAGGAVAGDADPVLDWYGGGWLGGRADSQDRLLALTNADTLIVPAGGPVLSQAGLAAEAAMTRTLYERLNDLIRSGCSAECMADEGALDGLGRTWQDPQAFLYAAYKGLWAHHYNLAPDIL